MDDKKNPSAGAPSSDTTSALFVSARKKQLEQQETERRAKEKEDQRLAAEAEVRRLEQEVEERRRRAEEEARRVETDAAEAALRPSEPSPAQPQKAASKPSVPPIAIPAGLLANKKLLGIVGGGAAAVIVLVVVLIVALSGGGSKAPVLDKSYVNAKMGIEFMYPSGWTINDDGEVASVYSEKLDGAFMVYDAGSGVQTVMSQQGVDIMTATERVITMLVADMFELDKSDIPTALLQKTGDYVTGGVLFEDGEYTISVTLEALEGRMIGLITMVNTKNLKTFDSVVDEMRMTLYVAPETAVASVPSAAPPSAAPPSAAQSTPAPSAAPQGVPEPKSGDALNETVTLSDVGQTLSYPSSSFVIQENTGGAVDFVTRAEGLGTIGYIQTDVSNAGRNSDWKTDALQQVGSSVMDNVLSNGSDGIVLSDEAFNDEKGVLAYVGEATFVDEAGVSYKVYIRSAFWSKTDTAYVVYAIARNSHYEVCKTLATRIKDSVKFN